MTTVTTERLREIIAANDGMLNRGEASTITEELLAVREAQSVPVAYRYRYNGKHLASVGCGDMVSSWKYCEEAGLVNPDERYEHQELFTAPPALPANVIGRPATPDDSPYPATISGGCLLAQAWADGYNVRNAVTAAPAPAVNNLISVAHRLVGRYIANKGTTSEFIACVTPEKRSIGTGGTWDDWRLLDAALNAYLLNHSGDSAEKVPEGYKLVPVELLSTASMLIDLCRTHATLNGGGTYNQRVLSDCETTMNAIAILVAAAPTPTKAVNDA